ncbi:Uncharacterised protein [Wolbachia endosymbiont wPip_Mol of Culex molestus]|nr:Uncharacterised protein [Wolbachia endosymbiont wPip_Mol of Culex molestus]
MSFESLFSLSSTRITTTVAPIWENIPFTAEGKLPLFPSFAASFKLPAISTGLFSGNFCSSASGAVPIIPITDDLAVCTVLAPEVISITFTPCKNSSGIFSF